MRPLELRFVHIMVSFRKLHSLQVRKVASGVLETMDCADVSEWLLGHVDLLR